MQFTEPHAIFKLELLNWKSLKYRFSRESKSVSCLLHSGLKIALMIMKLLIVKLLLNFTEVTCKETHVLPILILI